MFDGNVISMVGWDVGSRSLKAHNNRQGESIEKTYTWKRCDWSSFKYKEKIGNLLHILYLGGKKKGEKTLMWGAQERWMGEDN